MGLGAEHESERGGWRREGLRFRRIERGGGGIEGFCTPQNRAEWEMVRSLYTTKNLLYSSCFILFFGFALLFTHSLHCYSLLLLSRMFHPHTPTPTPTPTPIDTKIEGLTGKRPDFWRKTECFHMRMSA